METRLTLSKDEYQKIVNLVYGRFGINLGTKKQSLVLNRLRKVLSDNNFHNFDQFYDFVLNDSSGSGLNILINKISTNLTYFAREKEHFDFFQSKALPELLSLNDRRDKIRLWCAGCSTGEEAYTLSIILNENQNAYHYNDYAVLATDISENALLKATKGIYSSENVEKLPKPIIQKYFQNHDTQSLIVKDFLKGKVLFRRLNLMRTDFPFKKKFHVIFCRNVMIYFDFPTREKLVEKFSHLLVDGGYLFIGHSESLGRTNQYFRYIKPAIYRKEA